MKYEMIFGDERLFDGAPEEATHAAKGGGFYKIENMSAKYVSDGIFNGIDVLSVGGNLIAERRIIAEPKRWTVDYQKAGRLPEVGCRVDFCHKLNTNWRTGEIKYSDNQVVVIKADDIDRPFVYEFDQVEFNPIETPAEKAQREEDEFVEELASGVSRYDRFISGVSRYDSFINGARAAYRKMKGGDNVS